jgi:hypothetical protein
MRARFCAHLLVWTAATGAAAQTSTREVYVFVGEHGETTFSDVAQPGAERFELEVTQPSEDALAELDRRIEQTLSVANSLEASRLARESARAAAADRAAQRAAQARQQPQVIYQDRYADSPYVLRPEYWPGRRPGHRPRPDHPDRPGSGNDRPRDSISRPFPSRN